MHKIILNNVRVYTNHGCLTEEELIGSEYRVDLEVTTDLTKSSKTDDLSDTVDYVYLNKVIKEEMAVRSKLLEHVAQRIIDRVFVEEEMVQEIQVKVSKLNPPLGGDVEMVTIQMEQSR
ncbi:dihydroneopterin aldolase [Nonlabens sp. Hel1_33_55]|uniref:dihydroneopterin aldolase n=1 Tax=Nonlabens sp. Hel1_33_55 TaxID=1336802 RepID=UPI000875BCBE|nr:dihydroneopterin aldolase [Nonlabens sp. Hel1_33_55]SCY33463.1 dihydroneopterin aldolase [Nonlabens sp. Hel1_33_55]